MVAFNGKNISSGILLQTSFYLIWFAYPVPCESLTDQANAVRPARIRRDDADGNNGTSDGDESPVKQKLGPAIKYQAVVMPKVYNKLQVPSQSYANTMDKVLNEILTTSELDMEEFYSLWEPLTVSISINIGNINELSEMDEEVTFAADLMLEWTDAVIKGDAWDRFDIEDVDVGPVTDPYFKTLDPEFLTNIWKPDIYIKDLVKVTHPEVMSEPVTLRLNEVTGQVIYISRPRIKMECEMDFQYYPADTQTCTVKLLSNSYSSDELDINWATSGLKLQDCGGSDYDFQLTDVEEGYLNESYVGGKTRQFAAVGFNIVARRRLSYHMVQTFLPSVFFIIITWLCFLIPATMVEARIGVAMTTLLTLTAMFASVREQSPTVSYVRAIDIWMLATIFFVFLTLFEFTVLIWLQGKKSDDVDDKDNAKPAKNGDSDPRKPYGDGDKAAAVEFLPARSEINRRSNAKDARREELKALASKLIEKYAFAAFAVLFVVFCIVYWSWLLVASGYLVWEVDPEFTICEAKD